MTNIYPGWEKERKGRRERDRAILIDSNKNKRETLITNPTDIKKNKEILRMTSINKFYKQIKWTKIPWNIQFNNIGTR